MEYRIIFAGEVLPGFEVSAVKRHLTQLMKLTDAQAERLFSGKPVTIKKGLDEEAAQRYIEGMESIGVVAKADPPLLNLEETLILEPRDERSGKGDEEITQLLSPRQQESSAPARTSIPSPQNTLFCRNCGVPVAPSMYRCPRCGMSLEQGKPRNKYVAAVLAIFLGWIGAHRIYLGQWWGALYFLFIALMWPVAIIEAIVFLVTPKERWDAKYGNVKSQGAVVAVVLIFLFVFVVGILAAIAIPAYHDYVLRAKVSMVVEESQVYRDNLEGIVADTGQAPSSNAEMGLPETVQSPNIAALTVAPGGVMTIELKGDPSLDGKTMVWTPEIVDKAVYWNCEGGSLDGKYRPPRCRGTVSTAMESNQEATAAGSTEVTSESGFVSLTLSAGSWQPMHLEGAEIAYINEQDDIGLVLVKETKQDFDPNTGVDAYTDLLMEYAFTDFGDVKFEKYGPHPVGSTPAYLFSFSGYSENIAIKGLVAAIEGKNDFYKLMAWTHNSRFDRNYNEMLQILESFKENNP